MEVRISAQLDEILGEYVEHVKKVTAEEMRSVAKEGVQKLKATSPVGKGKKAGRYASGWALKAQGNSLVIYNRTDYQLTHLLEYGHDLQQGGRWEGKQHIEPVEKWANAELPKRIEDNL